MDISEIKKRLGMKGGKLLTVPRLWRFYDLDVHLGDDDKVYLFGIMLMGGRGRLPRKLIRQYGNIPNVRYYGPVVAYLKRHGFKYTIDKSMTYIGAAKSTTIIVRPGNIQMVFDSDDRLYGIYLSLLIPKQRWSGRHK